MKKAFTCMFGIGAAIIALALTTYLLIAYWDKIAQAFSSVARAFGNVAGQFADERIGEETDDYYDI